MDIVFKTELIKGAKGDAGDALNFEVPTGAIIAYDGIGVPDGYEEVEAPRGMGSDATQSHINNNIYGVITNYAEGEITT